MKSFLFFMLFLLASRGYTQQLTVKGRVVSAEAQTALAGATIVVKGSTNGVSADSAGYFRMEVPGPKSLLVVSFIGYLKREVEISPGEPLHIEMEPDPNQLGEVLVSSGYEHVARERATGSFVQVDQTLLNLRVSPDIISRLEDNVPGLTFNRIGLPRKGAQSTINIRGENTIFGKQDPLIVLDNFPYTGDLNLINPNDIESVTVLRDAAAASIWGAQSANGVIVITTKKGSYNQPVQVSFNSNLTTAARPDPFYQPIIAPTDYIDLEMMLFDRGYYNSMERSNDKVALSPVVELLIAARDGKISSDQAQREIDSFRKYDNRNDIGKYLYRKAFNEQYAVQVKGGGASHRYFASVGFDRNLSSSVGNDFKRTTLNTSHTFTTLKQKLDFTTSMYYIASKSSDNAVTIPQMRISVRRPLPGYIPLADEDNNLVNIPHTYRESFIEDAMKKGLLDWRYNPIKEIEATDKTLTGSAYRLDLNANYRITPGLSAQLLYQYNKNDDFLRNRRTINSWYTRDLINQFTVVNDDGSLTRPIPLGDVMTINKENAVSNSIRAQLNYTGEWHNGGSLTALAGAEVRDISTDVYAASYYGYDDEISTNSRVNYQGTFKSYVNPSKRLTTPSSPSMASLTDRYLSYYGNAAYTHKQRYTFSASARLDQSNLFGVKANQKGVPLYSAGFSWKLSREGFYHLPWLPQLTLRATYGYNGNIDKSLSAYTTALHYNPDPILGLKYANVVNPPNPELRWERTRIVNLGMDLKTKHNRISGTVEFYFKNGVDLMGDAALSPQVGVVTFRGNTANTVGQGLDLNIRSMNTLGNFAWETALLGSYVTDKVSVYHAKTTSVGFYFNGEGLIPTEGKPLYSTYSFKWAGLDPLTGDPQGYFNDEVSKNYVELYDQTAVNEMVYHGSKRPVVFGALRNTFTLYGFSLSVNISYRLGYYIRMPSVKYSTVLQGNGGHADYYARWKSPGDELLTQVPSMPPAVNDYRDVFYEYASVLVKRGDHIRLQDINLSYTLQHSRSSWLPFQSVQLYAYASNLGVLFKKLKGNLDPDYVESAPPVRSLAAGLRIEF